MNNNQEERMYQAISITEDTNELSIGCKCPAENKVQASSFKPNKDGVFLHDTHYGISCEGCGEEIEFSTHIDEEAPNTSLIVESFDFDSGIVDIFLESWVDDPEEHYKSGASEQEYYKVIARWQGGGLVNGYEYRVDKITNADIEKVAGIESIQLLVKQARSDVENRVWDKYEQALKELE